MRRTPRRAGRVLSFAHGFSLMEVVLALAIIATCFVALLGLLPAGMKAGRDAANATIVASLFEDVHNRLQNQPLVSGVVALNAAPQDENGLSPIFFDDHGVYIRPDAPPEDLARRLYRADARVADWRKRPANTSGLRAVIVSLSWPVNEKTGEAWGKDNPKTTVTYGVSALTGPDWTLIYPPQTPAWKYQEKIEF